MKPDKIVTRNKGKSGTAVKSDKLVGVVGQGLTKKGIDIGIVRQEREKMYIQTANHVININSQSPNEIVQTILGYIK